MTDLLSVWYRALNADIGLRLSTTDTKRAKMALYKARSEAGDPALKGISIALSRTNPTHLLLIKKEALNANPSG
jgi:hypothetical protein